MMGGIDFGKVVQEAMAQGLIPSARDIGERGDGPDISPGFSTADTVTDISGRELVGCGQKAVETLRGRVDVASEIRKGCTFSVRLPLTMAITDGMLSGLVITATSAHRQHRYEFPPGCEARPRSSAGRGRSFQRKGAPIFRLHRFSISKRLLKTPTRGLLIIIVRGISVARFWLTN